MIIGGVDIDTKLALAPMAGVTDWAFRQICSESALVYTTTEMVSAKALCFGDAKTRRLMKRAGNGFPTAIQLFGSDPACMAEAARQAAALADVVDLNMGCPMPKIVSSGDGCALMKNPALAGEIVRSVRAAVRVPVTVKFRMGWDGGNVNACEFARRLEAEGAHALCLHARTRVQMYSGKADWRAINAVKGSVSIPVVANGDIFSPKDARRCLEQTGADMVMVGRAAFGNPFLLRDIARELEGLPPEPPPTLETRLALARRQIDLAVQDKGERIALLEARRHLSWTLRGQRGGAAMRREIVKLEHLTQLDRLFRDIMDCCGQWQPSAYESTREER